MAALARRKQAYRPATLKNYTSAHTLYIQFCLIFQIDYHQPTLDDLGAYAEWLITSGLSTSTVKNHLSSIKILYLWWNKPHILHLLRSEPWALTLRGLAYSTRPLPCSTTAVTIDHLALIIQACSSSLELLPVRIGVLFGFFGYLRVSNLAPQKWADWDPSRHSTWSDVQSSRDGILFNLKWSKTRQHASHNAAIPLPHLGESLLCPLRAWQVYTASLEDVSLPNPTPLLVTTAEPPGVPITIPRFRSAFHRAVALAGLAHCNYSPHSLRRGGATFSYQAGVPIAHIKAHGTWLSNAVDGYLRSQPKFTTPVALAFSSALIKSHLH